MKYSILITAASSYVIGCAFLYAQGFWSLFGVPVLQFAGIDELVRFALQGLGALLFSLALALIMSLLISAYFHILDQEGWKLRWNEAPKSGPLNWKEIGLLVTSSFFTVAIALTLVLIDSTEKWISVASLVLLAVLVFPSRVNPVYVKYIQGMMPPFVFSSLMAVLVSIPVYAYGAGLNQANQLKHGAVEMYKLDLTESEQGNWTYLGRLGSKYFFYKEEEGKLLIKADTNTIVISRQAP